MGGGEPDFSLINSAIRTVVCVCVCVCVCMRERERGREREREIDLKLFKIPGFHHTHKNKTC